MTAPVLLTTLYIAFIFGGAAIAYRYRDQLARSPWRIVSYTLALGVYCTSWTYFGAVGTAATDGMDYLPIYLGPVLLMLFGAPFLHRMNMEVHRDGATSISDFIGSRFQNSRTVAALVTAIMLVGTVTYIALQLRSVTFSFSHVTERPESAAPLIVSSALLALFAILFGARRYQVSQRNEVIMLAVAVESVIKLGVLLVVAGLAIWLLKSNAIDFSIAASPFVQTGFSAGHLDADFLVTVMLSALTIICLPRYFHISVMEARDPGDIVTARWGFLAYLAITVLAVLPIAYAGVTLLGKDAAPVLFVLSLPQATGHPLLAQFVFLGGLSAAMAMVVTEIIAISGMISNDLFAPYLLRRTDESTHLGRQLLWIRRAAIIALITAAALFAAATPSTTRLASVGMIAFAAIAQCAPTLICAVYRTENDALAAKASLATGITLWAITLLLPTIGASPDWFAGWHGANPTTIGILFSFGGNLLAYLLVSMRKVGQVRLVLQQGIAPISTMGALRELVTRFVGAEATAETLDLRRADEQAIDRASARAAERLIGTVVGASSARAIMASAVSGQGLGFAEIAQMLDASGQSLHFSQGLLAATLDNIDVGVSVVDRDLRLIAWNGQYLDLFQYPPGLVRVGVPIADLIRFNATRGDCGPGEVNDHVARRLEHMRSRKQHSFERHRTDGRVIKTVGGPMPDGGYVMSFTDITLEAQARAATENARRDLERAVEERTAELSEANAKLASAMLDKTRFLAAASHDLLQPLHAAMLFSSALRRRLGDPEKAMLAKLDRSIASANDLLRALLDISKLDAGGVTPQPTHFPVRDMLVDLAESLRPLAEEKGLRLRVGPASGWVRADASLLRSIIQNLLSNAIRYTDTGGIIVAVRTRPDQLHIEVRDSGIGIPDDKLDAIFREFERLGHGSESGIGLSLAIVERSAALIGAQVSVRSKVGVGSCFTLTLPRATDGTPDQPEETRPVLPAHRPLRLLAVDDDPTNRVALRAVLEEMGHRCVVASCETEAMTIDGPIDGALVDFQLGGDRDGIALIHALRQRHAGLSTALVTAERDDDTLGRARQNNIAVLSKPLAAPMLEQWLADIPAEDAAETSPGLAGAAQA